MLFYDRAVLDRHRPASEVDHSAAMGGMPPMQGSSGELGSGSHGAVRREGGGPILAVLLFVLLPFEVGTSYLFLISALFSFIYSLCR